MNPITFRRVCTAIGEDRGVSVHFKTFSTFMHFGMSASFLGGRCHLPAVGLHLERVRWVVGIPFPFL